MHHHPANKAEQAHQNQVREIGCIVSLNEYGVWTPGDLHHCTWFLGMGQRVDHMKVICLSPDFHRTGGPGIAFHATGRKVWEPIYGREQDLYNQVMEMLSPLI